MCLPFVIHRGHHEAIIGELEQWHELGAPEMKDPELESEKAVDRRQARLVCARESPHTPTEGPGKGRLLRAFQAASLSE